MIKLSDNFEFLRENHYFCMLKMCMSKKIVLFLCVTMCFAAVAAAADKKFTLVIDPGHGGHDAGALGAFSKEKDINLNVALAFGKNVERNCPDVRVVYTRKGDQFVPLHERANIANRHKADLFISIHTNALPGGKVSRGLETYTLGMHRAADNFDVAKRENSVILIEKDYKRHYEGFDPRSSESYIMFEFMQDKNMAQSVELARFVQKRACAAANRQNKGVKQAGFLVLRETSMPSCLIELGFITTSDEEQYLNTESGINALGQGIYQAFVDYKKKYDSAITVPYQAETKQEVSIPTVVPETTLPQPQEEAEGRKGQGKAVQEEPAEAGLLAAGGLPVQGEQADSSGKAVRKPREEQQGMLAGKPLQEQAYPADEPVFKVQILANNRRLAPGSEQLKGIGDVDCYEEGGLYKYTCGASTDYNEIYRLRKEISGKFPEAFIIAFKGGSKMNVAEAVREFKNKRNKR